MKGKYLFTSFIIISLITIVSASCGSSKTDKTSQETPVNYTGENINQLLTYTVPDGYHIDTVMDAARAAKAGGGTVIHAKGTGMELAKKYLGVSLVEEKEVILIVTKSREKNQIMKAIMEQAGLDSKERTIVFSLPVTSVAGIRMLEEDIQDDLL